MGNGQAPGTAIGLGATGTDTVVTGVGAWRSWEAGLAVFFFAAFFTAGLTAGFFLAAWVLLVLVTGFFLAGFVLAAAFFLADFALAGGLFLADADFAFDFDAVLRVALFACLGLRVTFFFADFFLLAIRTSFYRVQFTWACADCT
jgi:hypothetical protein